MQKPNVIIFDWDNTLVDTWYTIHDALNKTLEHFGHSLWELEDFKNNSHQSSKDLFPLIFKDKFQEAILFFYQQIDQYHLSELKALPYAEELLTFLFRKNIPIALVSNKRSYVLKKEVEHLGWGKFFKEVIGSGDAARDKPHPDPIMLAMDRLDYCLENSCWYVGDTITDWIAAKASGCQPIALWTNPDNFDKKLEFAVPHIKSCYELYLKISSF